MAFDNSQISDNHAEATVIATLIYHPDFILHTDYLKPNYFYDSVNGTMYWAIQELYRSGVETIDALNITNILNSSEAKKQHFEQGNINIQEYVATSEVASRHTLEEYKIAVNNVVTMSFKRELNKIATEIQSMCLNQDLSLAQIDDLVNEKINSITEKYLTSDNIEIFGTKVKQLWEDICLSRNENGYCGILSKYGRLNEYFTYEPGELILLKARMKKGKSAFFMNEAIDKIKNGVPTLYYDTEMSDSLFYQRMLANLTGIEIKRIKSGDYSHSEDLKIKEANEWIEKRPLVHIYAPVIKNNDEIYATHKVLKYKMGLQFSIFDYIKSDVRSTSENYNILGEKCDFLKNHVAGELGISMLAGAQLNRNNQVADSDKLERYVSASILWRDKTPDEIARDTFECGNYLLHVDLNRLGEQMGEDEYIDFKFDGSRMRIEEAKQHEQFSNPFQI